MNNLICAFVYDDININSDNYLEHYFELHKIYIINNLEDHFPRINYINSTKLKSISNYDVLNINFKDCIFYGNSRINGLPVFITKTIYQIRKEKINKLL